MHIVDARACIAVTKLLFFFFLQIETSNHSPARFFKVTASHFKVNHFKHFASIVIQYDTDMEKDSEDDVAIAIIYQ